MPAPPLSLSLAGLRPEADRPWGPDVRSALRWSASIGFTRVTLDAAVVRARDLSRSARRDLASAVRRGGLRLGGLDLWIPETHFADPAHADRAIAAVAGAAELLRDLASLGVVESSTLHIALPASGAESAGTAIADAAAACGVTVADHAWPPRSDSALAIGLDPAVMLAAGVDPAIQAASLRPSPVVGRLADADATGRTPLGRGRLDVNAYVAALITRGVRSPLVVDLRGLRDQAAAAKAALDRSAA